MKSEQRHKLHTNVLAQWLGVMLERIRPYATAIVAGLAALVVVVALVGWWSRHSTAGTREAWDALNKTMASGNLQELDDTVEKFSGTTVGNWGAVVAGDRYLRRGSEELLQNKATANQQLQKALENYLAALKQSQDPRLRERATFGLARTYESLCGTRRAENELEKAIESYETVVKQWPDGPFAPIAQRRLEDLRDLETRRFYDRLAQYEPKAPVAPAADSAPAASKTAPEKPKPTDSKPAADAKPTAEPKPAADAKPATEAKPAAKEPEKGK